MPGKKGMVIKRRKHPGCNEYSMGYKERERVRTPWSFKPKIEVIEAMESDRNSRGLSKAHYLDLAIETLLGETAATDTTQNPSQPELDPVISQAIRDAIANKEIAISRERKTKNPDQELIGAWETEIEKLSEYL